MPEENKKLRDIGKPEDGTQELKELRRSVLYVIIAIAGLLCLRYMFTWY